MKNPEFRQWLSGWFELSDEEAVLAPEQLQVIVNHLNLAEAVEGKLDETNTHIRNELEAFRARGQGDEDSRRVLTDSLRAQVISS